MMKMYEHWLVKHGKNYNAIGEKERRFEIFKDNLRFVDEQNSVPGRTYKLGLTKFADLTNEEYRAMYLGAKMEKKEKLRTERSQRYLHKAGDDDDLPSHIDWREKGAVTEVKDQGQCGKPFSHYSFFKFSLVCIFVFLFAVFLSFLPD